MDNSDIDMGDGQFTSGKNREGSESFKMPVRLMHGADFVPQVLSCVAASSIVIHSGAHLAFSAVLLPELMAPHSALTINHDEASWIASIVAISTPVGSLMSGPLMDKFGRKAVCKLTCLPIVLSWVIIACARNVWSLYCGRFMAGLSGGLASASIVYISEVTHPRWRATLLCLVSIFVSLGILVVCTFCLWLDYKQLAIMFAVMGVANLLVAWPLPETPHWLLRNRSTQKAIVALHWLYKRDLCYEHQLELLLASNQTHSASHSSQKSFIKYFSEYKKTSILKPIGILMVIFVFQQISGAYVVIFYAVNILNLVGGKYGSSVSEYTVFAVMGIIRFVMSIATAFASRKCGRRPISIVSGLGMAVSALIAAVYITVNGNSGNLFQNDHLEVSAHESSLLNVSSNQVLGKDYIADGELYLGTDNLNSTKEGNFTVIPNAVDQHGLPLPLICVIVFVFFSSLGVLVIPWTLIGELSPSSVRGSCGGFIMAFTYIVMFAVVKAFPYLLHIVKSHGIFYVFSATSFLGSLFVFVCLPETQGKTYEEIEDYFR